MIVAQYWGRSFVVVALSILAIHQQLFKGNCRIFVTSSYYH